MATTGGKNNLKAGLPLPTTPPASSQMRADDLLALPIKLAAKADPKADPKAETKPETDIESDSAAQKTIAVNQADRQAKMDALKKKSEAAREKAIIDGLRKVELFDSTKASSWKTTGSHSLGAMRMDDNSIMVTGKNIGAEQREPDWSSDQLEAITKAKSTILNVQPVNNTRRSVMDPAMEFVGRDEMGSIVPTEAAYVSTLDPSQYCIGIGPEKYDTTGTPRYYADVVVADMKGNWLVNQWTSEGIVLEGVAQNVLQQQNRPGNTSGRRIGHHFARLGLPAYAFGPLFNTLYTRFDGCMSQVTPTRGYYWVNASWGVSSFAATFSYMTDNNKMMNITNLTDVMRMLDGKSSMCLGTIAISVTCPAKMVDGKPVPDKTSYGLSIKMHNAFSINVVDYHGPPQQGSTGMLIPARIAQQAKALKANVGAAAGTMGSIFSATSGGVFGTAGANVATTKDQTGKEYI